MVCTNGAELVRTDPGKFSLQIKLGDFGSAKQVAGGGCTTGLSTGNLGTLRWSAPEAVQAGENVGKPTMARCFAMW